MRLRNLIFVAAIAGALGGCGHVAVHGAVYAPAPRLAHLGPDLYVVADHGRPVFFADNWYWLYQDGIWYRSSYWDHGWIVVSTVPTVIATIDQPWIYVHWRTGPYYAPRPWPRDHRVPYTRPHPVGNRVPPPATRDHRRVTPPVPARRDHRF